jgi:hypothetical protein
MIYANSGGYDNLALVRFSQVPLENRHQLIWTRHFGSPIENWSDQGFMLRFSVTIDGLVERPGLLRQLGI